MQLLSTKTAQTTIEELNTRYIKFYLYLGAFAFIGWGLITDIFTNSKYSMTSRTYAIPVLIVTLYWIDKYKPSIHLTKNLIFLLTIVVSIHFYIEVYIYEFNVLFLTTMLVHNVGCLAALNRSFEIIIFSIFSFLALTFSTGLGSKYNLTLLLLGQAFISLYHYVQSKYKENVLSRLVEQEKHISKLTKAALTASHDIKSPLLALNMSKTYLDKNDPAHSLIIQSIDRIETISSQMLNSYKSIKTNINDHFNMVEALSEVLEEKKLIYGELILEANLEINNFHISANKVEVTRAIGNLINNACDATIENKNQKILIKLYAVKDQMILDIIDNGMGFSDEQLAKLNSGIIHSTKINGNGIGLIHSIELLKKNGLSYKIAHTDKNGTIQRIVLS